MSDISFYKKQKEEFLDELNKNFQKSAFLRGYYDFKFADLMKTYIYLDPKYKTKEESKELENLNETLDMLSEIVDESTNSKETINLFYQILQEKSDFVESVKKLEVLERKKIKNET